MLSADMREREMGRAEAACGMEAQRGWSRWVGRATGELRRGQIRPDWARDRRGEQQEAATVASEARVAGSGSEHHGQKWRGEACRAVVRTDTRIHPHVIYMLRRS